MTNKDIEINGKTYQLVKTLSYREGLEIEDHLSDLLDIEERLKSGDKAQIDAVMEKLKSLKPKGRKLIVSTITKSLGLTEDQILDMPYADVILLFGRIWKANSEIPDFFGKSSQSHIT